MKRAGLFALTLLLLSCGPSKALIDYTMSEAIVWPGSPAKPRIKYLWSLQRLRGGEGPGKLVRYLAGDMDVDVTDPRSSDVMVKPHGIFVDSKNRLYVTDTGARRVAVINLDNAETFFIKSMEKQVLISPIGVVSEPGGRIYVSDSERKKVAVYSSKGKFLKYFEGDFKRPTGLAINLLAGLIYVVDTWEHTIYVYNLEGKRLQAIGQRGEGIGQFNYPTHAFIDRDGLIYVSDTLNFRVQVFSPTGRVITSFGFVGDTYDAFDKIKGISVDSGGNIYVVDSVHDTVKIYNIKGQILLFFGGKGSFYGKFVLPTGIYIDSRDRIFVSDSANMRVQAFELIHGPE